MISENPKAGRGPLRVSFDVPIDAGLFLVALVARYAFYLTGRSPFSVDAEDYVDAASNLLAHGRIFDPDLMPGYPVIRLLLGAGTPHFDMLLAAATAVLVAILARGLFSSRIAAGIAGLAVALHPNLAAWAGSGLTEPSTTFLMMLSLVLLYRRDFAWGCLFLVASLTIRPTLSLLAPLLLTYFSLVLYRDSAKQWLGRMAIFAAIFVGFFGPWWIHNYAAYDRFVPLNLGGPYTLYVGNNPAAVTGSGLGGIDIAPDDPLLKVEPLQERRRQMGEAARRWILENPYRFLELSIRRFALFWHVEPGSNATVWLTIQPYHFLFLGFLVLGWRQDLLRTLPLVAMVGYFCAVHSALVSLPRYQFQVTPIIALLGVGWITLRLENFAVERGWLKAR